MEMLSPSGLVRLLMDMGTILAIAIPVVLVLIVVIAVEQRFAPDLLPERGQLGAAAAFVRLTAAGDIGQVGSVIAAELARNIVRLIFGSAAAVVPNAFPPAVKRPSRSMSSPRKSCA